MTSVIEEPRKSTSTTSESCDQKMACILPIIPSYHVAFLRLFQYFTHTHIILTHTDVSEYEHDPLADAIYIRANFTYIPRNPKELSIKSGDVFHIHDEAPPGRFRSSFWVSRLSADGTDEQVGAIPNSMKAQEYLEAQGECKNR